MDLQMNDFMVGYSHLIATGVESTIPDYAFDPAQPATDRFIAMINFLWIWITGGTDEDTNWLVSKY